MKLKVFQNLTFEFCVIPFYYLSRCEAGLTNCMDLQPFWSRFLIFERCTILPENFREYYGHEGDVRHSYACILSRSALALKRGRSRAQSTFILTQALWELLFKTLRVLISNDSIMLKFYWKYQKLLFSIYSIWCRDLIILNHIKFHLYPIFC